MHHARVRGDEEEEWTMTSCSVLIHSNCHFFPNINSSAWTLVRVSSGNEGRPKHRWPKALRTS